MDDINQTETTETETNKEIEIFLCDHVRANGTFCQSPAITGDAFCYFHKRDRDRQKRILNNLSQRRANIATGEHYMVSQEIVGSKLTFDDNAAELFSGLHLPALEDANSIQVCLTDIYRAIATQQINPLVAGRLLYTLQIAALNLKHTSFGQAYNSAAQTTDDESPIDPDPWGTRIRAKVAACYPEKEK
ncbi:MAG: hypothetical protein JWO13_2337 [Acidobacteriales bacterium]|nr:hypothetical protein [Terriglobales bacterium]